MATGTVIYWNGSSGWIKQTNVERLPTAETYDVMLMSEMVESGTISLHVPVTFSIRNGVAYGVTVDIRGTDPKPEPEPDSPPPPIIGDSP